MIYHCRARGKAFRVETGQGPPSALPVEGIPGRWTVTVGHRRIEVEVGDVLSQDLLAAKTLRPVVAKAEPLRSPMPGIVTRVAVAPGQAVKAGELLLVLEAMKMANEVCARADATVHAVLVSDGQAVSAGQDLLTLG